MFRPVTRAATAACRVPKSIPGRRCASTAVNRSGTWRGAAVRWGLAGAVVYYYNTATAFAEEPQFAAFSSPETARESEPYATIDSIAEQRRAQVRAQSDSTSDLNASVAVSEQSSPAGLEAEAEQQGAFNEETGEINWDCPCLGGMAHGPCGEQFKAAFSCFVYSTDEPKGINCIEHFKTMQNCFREHPDIYGAELDDEEPAAGEGVEEVPAGGDAAASQPHPEPAAKSSSAESASIAPSGNSAREKKPEQATPAQTNDAEVAESDLVPRAWHDTRNANETAK